MSAQPLFELPTDEEELEELRSVGIDLNGPVSEPQLIAEASDLLRREAYYAKEIAKLEEIRDAEIARISMRYDTQIASLDKRRSYLNTVVVQIAQMVSYPAKKKSIKVGFGTIGFRASREKIEVTDTDKALTFAKETVPQAVKVKESLVMKEITDHILTKMKETGEIPEGFEHHASVDEYYAKAETLE